MAYSSVLWRLTAHIFTRI
ncbi:hypothetical protein Bhyg_04482 [Pseudolycoriella hygida]|uniref:Uncharacterized protein n=1 Tax=Pseudolycoriella hygida TaxID=35572 RepID=A0A9Q0NFD1_9DIPT|nr:hypothetical protein Bhyg_04482 [Pseudolycoriella hygida]